jgi:hypothetical protein
MLADPSDRATTYPHWAPALPTLGTRRVNSRPMNPLSRPRRAGSDGFDDR